MYRAFNSTRVWHERLGRTTVMHLAEVVHGKFDKALNCGHPLCRIMFVGKYFRFEFIHHVAESRYVCIFRYTLIPHNE